MVKETDARPGESVQVGSVDLLVAVGAQHEGGELIGHQEQDAGAESSLGFLGGQGGQSQTAEKEVASRDEHGENTSIRAGGRACERSTISRSEERRVGKE